MRELRNAVERAAAICGAGAIDVEHLPASVRGEGRPSSAPASAATQLGDKPLKEHLKELERELIQAALEKTGGNQVRAAELLQMPRSTLLALGLSVLFIVVIGFFTYAPIHRQLRWLRRALKTEDETLESIGLNRARSTKTVLDV